LEDEASRVWIRDIVGRNRRSIDENRKIKIKPKDERESRNSQRSWNDAGAADQRVGNDDDWIRR